MCLVHNPTGEFALTRPLSQEIIEDIIERGCTLHTGRIKGCTHRDWARNEHRVSVENEECDGFEFQWQDEAAE